ncbi:MAG TPA: hypothetical protein VHO90_13850 [Bacteroidales bacterium]|nr:hypothetical protein [Bacteroidales bacterium]
MTTKWTYQQKVKMLPIIGLFVLVVVYWVALSETFSLRREYSDLKTDAVALEKAPFELRNLKKELARINDVAGKQNSLTGFDPLMELNGSLASKFNVTLFQYEEPHIFKYKNYTIETRITTFEASFIPCLKVLYNLEKMYHNGKIVSVSFSSKADHKTNRKRLYMQVLFQSIQNENNTISESIQDE